MVSSNDLQTGLIRRRDFQVGGATCGGVAQCEGNDGLCKTHASTWGVVVTGV